MTTAALISRLVQANAPADLIADIAVALARADAVEQTLEERRARDRARKAFPRNSTESEDCSEMPGIRGTTPSLDKETSPKPPKEINLSPERETRARGARLPEGWRPEQLPPNTIAGQIIDRRGQLWARRCFETFENHWRAKTGKDALKADWQKTWANWVIEQDRRDGKNGRFSEPQPSGIGRTAAAALAVFGPPAAATG